MKKYEYAVRNWQGNQVPNVEKYLNNFGAAGWRLVSIHESPWTGSDIQVTAYFENEYWDDEDEDDDE